MSRTKQASGSEGAEPDTADPVGGPGLSGEAPDDGNDQAGLEANGPDGDPTDGPEDADRPEAAATPEPSDDSAAHEPAQDPVQALTAERDQYLDDLQRLTAEFANFRRQASKRAAEVSAQAGARLAEALLVVFDACEAAARQGVEGTEEIAGQLETVLGKEGLEVIHDDGLPFDPARHEATLREPADEDAGEALAGPVVAETLRTGYAWNGRVLRAAMVKVKG